MFQIFVLSTSLFNADAFMKFEVRGLKEPFGSVDGCAASRATAAPRSAAGKLL